MKHFKILAWFDSPQKESYMKSSAKNIEYELPFELLNNSRLKILGNQEIMENLKNACRESLVHSLLSRKNCRFSYAGSWELVKWIVGTKFKESMFVYILKREIDYDS